MDEAACVSFFQLTFKCEETTFSSQWDADTHVWLRRPSPPADQLPGGQRSRHSELCVCYSLLAVRRHNTICICSNVRSLRSRSAWEEERRCWAVYLRTASCLHLLNLSVISYYWIVHQMGPLNLEFLRQRPQRHWQSDGPTILQRPLQDRRVILIWSVFINRTPSLLRRLVWVFFHWSLERTSHAPRHTLASLPARKTPADRRWFSSRGQRSGVELEGQLQFKCPSNKTWENKQTNGMATSDSPHKLKSHIQQKFSNQE